MLVVRIIHKEQTIILSSRGRAAPKTHPACVWLDALRGPSRGICGSLVSLRRREQPQILRLRARPTRKRSGSESLCGRFAQDDIIKFMNNPDSGPRSRAGGKSLQPLRSMTSAAEAMNCEGVTNAGLTTPTRAKTARVGAVSYTHLRAHETDSYLV